MKPGNRSKMISVRDLLRRMRTHSVAAVVTAVSVAAVTFGGIASHVFGSIEVDAGSISVDTSEVQAILEDGQAEMGEKMNGVYLRTQEMCSVLDVVSRALQDSGEAVEVIGNTLPEIGSIEETVKQSFQIISDDMELLKSDLEEGYSLIGRIENLLTETSYGAPPSENPAALEALLEESVSSILARFSMLSADVSAVTDKLRTYEVRAQEFHQALDRIDEAFSSGSREITLLGIAAALDGADDDLMQMIARVKLSSQGVDYLSVQLDDSMEAIAALNEQVAESNRVIGELQNEIASSNERIDELTNLLDRSVATVDGLSRSVDGVTDGMASMRTQVDEAVQAGREARQATQDSLDAQGRALEDAQASQQEALANAQALQQETLANAQTAQQESLTNAQAKQQETLDQAMQDQAKALTDAQAKQQETLDQAAQDQAKALTDAQAKQQETLDKAAQDQTKVLTDAQAAQQKTLEKAAQDQTKVLENAQTVNSARGQGYKLITFTFDVSKNDISYTFDFSGQLSNYGSISRDDILVRSFHVFTVGERYEWMGVGATIDMEKATYDTTSGHLTVTEKLLSCPFGSQSGTVTFAVIGGL